MPLTDIDAQRLGDSVADKLGVRNLIINGAMQVSQRTTSTTGVTTGEYRACDRWRLNVGALGTWTIEQSTDAPNGFSNSFKATCTTADASPASSDALQFYQRIEAQNLQHLAFGTSDAKAFTVSFYIKSNKTGSATLSMYQNDNSNKQFSTSYTVNSANTWEYKTITIPGDTAGLFNNDNGLGLALEWWLNSGSDFTGGSHSASWTTFDNTNRNASNFGLGGAVNDYFQITGVQLEVGNTATPFEHRSYEEDLTRCQRYFQGVDTRNDVSQYYSFGVGMWVSAAKAYAVMSFQTEMRALPTSVEVSAANTFFVNSGSQSVTNFTTIALNQQGRNSGVLAFDGGSGGTNGRVGRWLNNNNNTAYCFFSAEL